jgi:quinoprotein glucose dehydrogenase
MYTPPGVGYDTIGMPGNQGGSNWGTTAANPAKGMVYVVGVNQVAILRLEDVTTRRPAGREGGPAPLPAQDGFLAYQKHCESCHGRNLEGSTPGSPSLVGITERMDDDAIRALVNEGRGTMRAVAEISQRDLTAVIDYLTNTNPYGRGGGAGARGAGPAGPPLPPGPVVARGGAPRPPLPAYRLGPYYSGIGGNAGNMLYPADAPDVPTARYMSDYGVMATSTKPPYTTLTAYDLNTGVIKWQIAPGDDLRTVERGGPRGTGGVGARNGVLVTKTGLVFHAGGDNKIRAYDEDTGQVLWTGSLPGSARGIPAMYELRGRQYLVIASPGDAPGGGGAAAGATPVPIAPNTPRGYIAFALPRR